MTPLVSYAQNFEDVLLWRALQHVENGFYIDIGAQDPVVDSVSLVFHERGWKGIHAEPTPRYAAMLRQQRPGDTVIEAAVSNLTGLLAFFEIQNTGISTGEKKIAQEHRERGFEINEISVPTVPLSSILQSCGKRDIHWLKIDVEGFENSVLTSWGRAKARPWIVVIESTLPLSQIESYQDWEPELLRRHYLPVFFDGLNRYYVSKEKAELKQAFLAPANVFDSFSINGTASNFLHYHLNNLHAAELAAIGEKISRASNEIELLHAHKNKLAVELEAVSAKAQHAADENSELNAERNRLFGNLTDVEAKLQRVERENLDERAKLNAERNRLSGKLIDVEAKLQRVERENLDERAEKDRLVAQLLDVNAQLQRVSIENTEVHAHKNRLAGELTDASARLQVASGEIAGLRQLDEKRRAELSTLNLELVRSGNLLVAAKDEHTASMEVAMQEAVKSVQLLASREREFSEQSGVQAELHRTALASARNQIDAANASLLSAKDEFATLLKSAHQEIHRAASALAESEQRGRNDLDRARLEQLALRQEFLTLLNAAHQETQRAANALAQSELRERNEVARGRLELSALQQELATVRESRIVMANDHRRREMELTAQLERGNVLNAELERALASLAMERDDFIAKSAEATSHLQNLFALAKQETVNLHASFSWRLTRPLRALGRVFSVRLSPTVVEAAAPRTDNKRIGPLDASRTVLSMPPAVLPINSQEATMALSDPFRNDSSSTRPVATLGELLRLESRQFVESAYLTLLGRPVDPSGLDFYVARIDTGIPKIQIVTEVCASDELKHPDFINASELLGIDGEMFVECAYCLLLKRPPDIDGGRVYLNQLLKGVPKIHILAAMRGSEEGRNSGMRLAGLDELIARHERTKRGWKGFVFRLFGPGEGDSAAEVRLRCIEQQIALLGQKIASGSSCVEKGLRDVRDLMEAQAAGAEVRSERLAQDIVGLQFATMQQRGQIKSIAESNWGERLLAIQGRLDQIEKNVTKVSEQSARLVSSFEAKVSYDSTSPGSAAGVSMSTVMLETDESRALEKLAPRARDIYQKIKADK